MFLIHRILGETSNGQWINEKTLGDDALSDTRDAKAAKTEGETHNHGNRIVLPSMKSRVTSWRPCWMNPRDVSNMAARKARVGLLLCNSTGTDYSQEPDMQTRQVSLFSVVVTHLIRFHAAR